MRLSHKARTTIRVVGLVAVCFAAAVLAESQVGGLYVITDPPGAEVYVANQLRGISPCAIAEVGMGPVEIKAVKEGFLNAKDAATVNPNKITKVELKLEALPNVGNILVLVEPTGSDIILDYVPFGKTPCRIVNIKEGTHKMEVGRDKYAPMHVDVTVVSGKDQLVKGELVETGEEWLGTGRGGPDVKDLGVEGGLDVENAKMPDEMPEAKAFDPVRRLLDGRKYDQALQLLENMAKQPATRDYSSRINRDKRYIQDVKGVVLAGNKALEGKVGQNYSITLKGGIAIEGKVLRATPDKIVLEVNGAEKDVELERVNIKQIIKLASATYAPDKASNQALFAVLYAMEKEWNDAVDALQRASAGGFSVTEAMNYVTSEKDWAAALVKEKKVAQEKKEEKVVEDKREKLTGVGEVPDPVVLVDRNRGGWIEKEVTGCFEKLHLVVKTCEKAPTKEQLQKACVLVVKDMGEGEYILPYDEETVKNIVDFVQQGGGGFVFFGTPRPLMGGDRGTPYDALLLKQFQIAVRTGRMQVDDRAARETRGRPYATPTQKGNPITQGVEKVFFSLNSSAILAGQGAAVLMATPPFVTHSSQKEKRGPVAVLAVRQMGKGRVVVFSAVPDIWDEDTGANALKLVAQAVGWAAFPRASQTKAAKAPAAEGGK